jgi:hypothetical protein
MGLVAAAGLRYGFSDTLNPSPAPIAGSRVTSSLAPRAFLAGLLR